VRILLLNQYFHPDRSATAQLLTELAHDLSREHDVFVVTGRPSYAPEDGGARSRGLVSRERLGRVRVARVWSTAFDRADMPGRLANYGTYLASSVAGALAVRRPDVVVAFTDPPPIAAIGSLAARIRGVPFVVVVKDLFPEIAVEVGALRNPLAVRTLRAISNALLRNAARVVSIGRDMDRRLAERGVPADRIETIHDWADGSLVAPLDRPSPLRAAWGLEDRFVVMHSGNVGLTQDLDIVLDAADELRSVSDVIFAIVGDGASRDRLEAEVRRRRLGNVRFLPYQSKADLGASLAVADVHLVGLRHGLTGYVTPSKVYGIMAAGRPFIAQVDADAEPAMIVEEARCGIRIEPGDANALAKAVLEMRDRDLAELGANARRAFEERFERRIATRRYADLLTAVADGAR
jgi:putative colanic acid biosynthesis glycosyltransferase WcaI